MGQDSRVSGKQESYSYLHTMDAECSGKQLPLLFESRLCIEASSVEKMDFAYFLMPRKRKTSLLLLYHPGSHLRLKLPRTILLRPPLDSGSVSSAVFRLL